jgi:hypothetical protein
MLEHRRGLQARTTRHPFVPFDLRRRTEFHSPVRAPTHSDGTGLVALPDANFTGRTHRLLRAAVIAIALIQATASSTCSRFQRRSRFQQISDSLRAVATRAILALARLRIRV